MVNTANQGYPLIKQTLQNAWKAYGNSYCNCRVRHWWKCMIIVLIFTLIWSCDWFFGYHCLSDCFNCELGCWDYSSPMKILTTPLWMLLCTNTYALHITWMVKLWLACTAAVGALNSGELETMPSIADDGCVSLHANYKRTHIRF